MSNNSDAISAHEHATWQGAAETYAENMSPFTTFAGQIPLLIEVGDISAKDTVLELGCGPGLVAIACAALGAKVPRAALKPFSCRWLSLLGFLCSKEKRVR